MVAQARAEATRDAILAAAVGLFAESGYGNTALSDVIETAGVTKGAAYYHFPTKESVAVALIERTDARIGETLEVALAQPGSALENLIRASFVIADLSESDPEVRVGMQLRHGLPQISAATATSYSEQQMVGVATLREAIAEGDLRAGLDPEAAARTIFAAIVGIHVTSAASRTHPREGLKTMWQFLLQGMLAGNSAEYFSQFLARIERQLLD